MKGLGWLGWLVAVPLAALLLASGIAVACLWGVMTPSVDIVADGVRVSLPSLDLGLITALGLLLGFLGALLGLFGGLVGVVVGVGVPLLLVALPVLLLVLPVCWLLGRSRKAPKAADNPRP